MFNANKRATEFLSEVEKKIKNSSEFKVGEYFENTVNGTIAEIDKLDGEDIIFRCYERIYGFFKTVNKPCNDVAYRRISIELFKKGIERGIFKKVEESINE